jgi:hypothetical protein
MGQRYVAESTLVSDDAIRPGPSGSCGRWRISSLSRAEPRTWPRSHQASIARGGGGRVAVLLCGANTAAVDFGR